MEVVINQSPFTAKSNSLTDILLDYGITTTQGMAIAINETVIPKARWPLYEVTPQDRITIIKAAQGG